MKDVRYYIPGGFFIMLGLLIMAVPQILVALAAGSVIMIGIAALQIGHVIRKAETGSETAGGREFDDDFLGRRFVRVPFSRTRYRRF